jgi:hypothetical protein
MRSERGQTAAEYMGALLVVSVVIAAIVSGPGPRIAAHLTRIVGCIATAADCTKTTAQAATPSATPAPSVVPVSSTVPTNGPTNGATPTTAAAAATTPSAAAPGPTPDPQPQAAPAAPWTGQAANLPQGGDRPYVPPKSSRGQPKKVPTGSRGKQKGYEDADGNIWIWNPPGSPTAHGGPHWDVEHKDGSHTNVNPDGSVRGPDNFPNKSRGGSSNGGGDDGGNDNTTKIVAGTAAGVGAGAAIWWGAKLLSPACGPFVLVCAVAF